MEKIIKSRLSKRKKCEMIDQDEFDKALKELLEAIESLKEHLGTDSIEVN
jgi:predicted AlkP superfamily phosphohydrolase/phosphomutase